MNPIPILAIPHLNRPDLLLRCLCSIDYPVQRLVIIQNGLDDAMLSTANIERALKPCVRSTTIIRHPNAGCAGSWNEVVKLFPAPWWFIAANDVKFTPGDLAKMADAGRTYHEHFAVMFGNHGHNAFILTKRGIDRVGLHDENIYPAYLEDCDWMYRRQLLGEKYLDVPEVNIVHGDDNFTGSCTIQSDPEIRAKNGRTHGNNFQYYRSKWGGNNGEEKFKTPFNDPHWPIWAWKFDTSFRAVQQW